MNVYRIFIKRVIDIFISLTALFILSPAFIIIAILLFFANDGKVFFYQLRPGKKEKIFKVVKFKSMNDKKDKDGKLLPDNLRLTPIGSFIRKTSLDEIPQLINVFKGDMSLIGPRPLLIEYLSLYTEEQARRHEVRPGITGWAQVNGRNSISWEDKFKYDIWYVNNLTFFTDMRILMMTIWKVLKKENIDFDASIQNRRFDGTN